MTEPSRYGVPLEALSGVQVKLEEQVEEHPADVQPVDTARWGGSLTPAYGDSMSGGGGGEGAGCDGGGGE